MSHFLLVFNYFLNHIQFFHTKSPLKQLLGVQLLRDSSNKCQIILFIIDIDKIVH